MTRILHQLGHRYNWNLESLEKDKVGDGVICAPRYMPPRAIRSLPLKVRRTSLFDPQFFVPTSRKGHLSKYKFFPDVVANGFDTTDYAERHAIDSAKRCLTYQIEHGFKQVVIPTRLREATPSDFISSQTRLFVEPFLRAYHDIGLANPLFLQLIVNDSMLKDKRFRDDLLNWVTGISELQGVYLIPNIVRRRKQITDIDYLLSALLFVSSLRQNSMKVVLGYLNTEAILLLASNPSAITIGSYENLRMFNSRAFVNEERGPMRGPTPRIYIPRLLQWINHSYIGAISRMVDDPNEFFDESDYRVTMFRPSYNWHFTKPEPYKHYFCVFSRQLSRIINTPMHDRIKAIRKEIQSAKEMFSALENTIVFGPDDDSSHLAPWLTALNLFEKEQENN